MKLYINIGLLLLILFMLYSNESIIQANTTFNKGFIVLMIILIANYCGMNSALLAAAAAIIMIYNTRVREYLEGGEVSTKGEAVVLSEEEEAEGERIEKLAKESQMNQVGLDRTIKTAAETASMEAKGNEVSKVKGDKEPVSPVTSPTVAEGLQNIVI